MAVYGRSNRRRYVLLLVVLTSVTLITLDRRHHDAGAIGAIGRVAHTVVLPVQRGVDAIARPVGNWFGGVFDSGSLKEENKKLRARIADLQAQQRAGILATQENAQLKDVLHLPILDNVPRAVARVVAHSPGNFESTVTLDRGSNDGIAPDMPVLAHDGVVGRVATVWRNGCTVLLITDSDFSVASRVSRVAIAGVASGRTGAQTMDFVPNNTTRQRLIKRGDLVETSGFNGSSFPAGLQVGRIAAVQFQPGGQLPIVRVQPFVDVSSLDYVAVLKWSPGQGPVATTTTTTTTKPPSSTTPTTVPGSTTSHT